MPQISQREARRLRRRVAELEKLDRDRLQSWTKEWPQGVDVGRTHVPADSSLIGSLLTARKLGHAVVVLPDRDGDIYFFACPLAAEKGD
jgi:hypothetical protein